jgi:hypothetical protein
VFRVAGVNSVGAGPFSEASAPATVPAEAPDAVPSFTASATSASIGLSWTAPASNGGSAITGYQIERSLVGSPYSFSQLSLPAAGDTSSTDNAVSQGNTYYYRLRACNAIGCGAWSSVVSASPVVPISVLNTFMLPVTTTKWSRPSTYDPLTDGVAYTPVALSVNDAAKQVFVATLEQPGGAKVLVINQTLNSSGDNPIVAGRATRPSGLFSAFSTDLTALNDTSVLFSDAFYLKTMAASSGAVSILADVGNTKNGLEQITYDPKRFRAACIVVRTPYTYSPNANGNTYECWAYDFTTKSFQRIAVIADLTSLSTDDPTIAVNASNGGLYFCVQGRVVFVNIDSKQQSALSVNPSSSAIAASPFYLFVATSSGVDYYDLSTNKLIGSIAGAGGANRLYWDNVKQRLYAGGDGTLAAYDFPTKRLLFSQSVSAVGKCIGLTQSQTGNLWAIFGDYVTCIRPLV